MQSFPSGSAPFNQITEHEKSACNCNNKDVFRVSPKMEVNTEAPKVSLLREQFEQAQFIKDRFLVPPEMARRSQEESIKKVTVDRLPGVLGN